MKTKNNPFFSHLVVEMSRYLNGLISEGSLGFFRRGPQVVLAGSGPANATDFQFQIQSHQINDNDKGIFNVERPDGRILVFRNPARIVAKFTLTSGMVSAESALRAYDQLSTHFFDHRTMEPILPPSLDQIPELKSRLRSTKAELIHQETRFPSGTGTSLPFQFLFSYAALFHSGNPLREETRTRSRVIDYEKSTSERSVI